MLTVVVIKETHTCFALLGTIKAAGLSAGTLLLLRNSFIIFGKGDFLVLLKVFFASAMYASYNSNVGECYVVSSLYRDWGIPADVSLVPRLSPKEGGRAWYTSSRENYVR